MISPFESGTVREFVALCRAGSSTAEDLWARFVQMQQSIRQIYQVYCDISQAGLEGYQGMVRACGQFAGRGRSG